MFLIETYFRDAVYHLVCFISQVSLTPSLQNEAMKWLQTVPGLVITEFFTDQYWSGLINSSQEIKAILNCNSCTSSQLAFQKPGTSSIKPTVNIQYLSSVTLKTLLWLKGDLLCEA